MAHGPLVLFTLIFVALALLHARTFFSPPYWDMIIGAFAEAIWLVENHFDFLRLWTEEPGALDGGAAVYKISVLPPLYAVLLDSFDTSVVFPILHLVSVVSSAASLTLFILILRNYVSNGLALWWTAVVFSSPLWSSQTASINMEMPLVAASTASLFHLQKGKYLAACLWACGAFLIKEAAIILLLALACWGPARWLLSLVRSEGTVSQLFAHPNLLLLGPLAFALGLEAAVGQAEVYTVDVVTGATRFLLQMPFLFPMTAAQIGLVAIFSLVWFLTARRAREPSEDSDSFPFALFLSILVFGFWLSFLLLENSLARYSLFILFPMAALLALLVPNGSLCRALAAVLILVGAANHGGWLMARVPAVLGRAGQYLERNMEFVEDLESNRRLCRRLEDEHFDTPIVANYPFVQMLTLPALGYVGKALPRVFAAGIVPTFANVRSFESSPPRDPETLFLYAPNNFSHLFMPQSLWFEEGDEIVLREEAVGAAVIVYRKARWAGSGPGPRRR